VMTPVGGEGSFHNAVVSAALVRWALEDGSGRPFDSSGGFLLPNGSMRSPDAAWVRRARLDELSREVKTRFLPLAPDFVVELRSPSDDFRNLEAKMEEYRDCGVRLGWLIDPEERRVHVYRPDRPIEILDGPVEISGDPELPGFVLDLTGYRAPSKGLHPCRLQVSSL
ncbi:MAG TPA: Uma2 family endonuclease, partial [Thermoanaerobaculia bacterium]|nr:Uma2 family endonuclease [Thermoanaerobaculia bacterium]